MNVYRVRRMVRSGSYSVDLWSLRSSFVNWHVSKFRFVDSGFRLVLTGRKK